MQYDRGDFRFCKRRSCSQYRRDATVLQDKRIDDGHNRILSHSLSRFSRQTFPCRKFDSHTEP